MALQETLNIKMTCKGQENFHFWHQTIIQWLLAVFLIQFVPLSTFDSSCKQIIHYWYIAFLHSNLRKGIFLPKLWFYTLIPQYIYLSNFAENNLNLIWVVHSMIAISLLDQYVWVIRLIYGEIKYSNKETVWGKNKDDAIQII